VLIRERRRGHRVRLVPTAALLLAVLTACGIGGDGGCTNTRLEVFPVKVADLAAPLELKAKLTDVDGKPIPGAEVELELMFKDDRGYDTGVEEKATTDASGVATLIRKEGLAGSGRSGWTPVTLLASWEPLGRGADAPAYCWAGSARGSLTCVTGGKEGSCSPLP
jgi:hypothetical protein